MNFYNLPNFGHIFVAFREADNGVPMIPERVRNVVIRRFDVDGGIGSS